MITNLKLFYGGQEHLPVSGKTMEVINPATKKVIAIVPRAGEDDVEAAVSSARRASAKWKFMMARDRANMLRQLARIIDDNREKLARMEVMDSGWPYTFVEQHHITRCIDLLDYYAGLIDKMGGRVVPIDPNFLSYTSYEPYGVVAVLAPWNAPLSTAFLGLAPALACGNTVILKPSKQTPLSSLYLGKLFKDAELPEGVFNVLSGSGSELGTALAKHPGVDKIALTGSVETGQEVMRIAASNIKGITLELGGKTPVLVFNDADLQAAAARVAFSAFLHQGQICTAASRLLLQDDIAGQFLEMLIQETRRIKIGDPFLPETQIGPMISAEHRQKVLNYIEKGKAEGAVLVLGGEIPTEAELSEGYYMTPTIFKDVDPKATIVQEEIFGPVLSVLTFSNEEEALELANDSSYGLGSSIWTNNLQKAHYLAKRLENGLVWINCLNLSHPAIPHGGHKLSGYGLEGGLEAAIQSYSKSKTTWVSLAR